jgi:hypothetical protein
VHILILSIGIAIAMSTLGLIIILELKPFLTISAGHW